MPLEPEFILLPSFILGNVLRLEIIKTNKTLQGIGARFIFLQQITNF
jgi:hypothetical protein